MAAAKTKTGIRAITIQQPYAAAMCAGISRFTRRGKATSFPATGEWIAIHCGSNNEHLNNQNAMKAIRKIWPDCPSNNALKATQKHILGFTRFRNGEVLPSEERVKQCTFMQNYPCVKPYCWETDYGYSFPEPIHYPKGQLQIWHLYNEGFGNISESGDDFFEKITDDEDVKDGVIKQLLGEFKLKSKRSNKVKVEVDIESSEIKPKRLKKILKKEDL